MSFTSAGVRVWDPSEPFSIHGASAAQGASINERIVGNFVDTAARDVAYAGKSSAAKAGVRCWIQNRGGYSYWDQLLGAWQWEPQNRLVLEAANFGGFSDSTTTTTLMDETDVVHRGGLRSIRVVLSGRLRSSGTVPISSDAAARCFLVRNGGELLRIAAYCTAGRNPSMDSSHACVDRVYKWSGTSTFRLAFLREGGSGGSVAVDSGWLQIFDLGPAD